MKLNELIDFSKNIAININMRCIEIFPALSKLLQYSAININMRCIEMEVEQRPYKPCVMININMRCIEINPDEGKGRFGID